MMKTYFTSYKPSSTTQLNRRTNPNIQNDVLINDLDRKSSYYYLWSQLESSFNKHQKEASSITFDDIIERDMKRTIVHMFLSNRPSYHNTQLNLDRIKQKDYANLDNTLYSIHVNADDLRNELLFHINFTQYQNPYIEDHHEYNDKIHCLLIELIPFLPTLMFILFPLEYLPILGYSIVLHAFLRSKSRFTDLTYNQSDDDHPIHYRKFIYALDSFLKEWNEGSIIVDEYNPNMILNISQFIIDTRKKLTYNPNNKHLHHYSLPSYFPFTINNLNTIYDQKGLHLKRIDVHYLPNRLYLYYEKLKCYDPKLSSPSISLLILKEDTDEIVSLKTSSRYGYSYDPIYQSYHISDANSSSNHHNDDISSITLSLSELNLSEYMEMNEYKKKSKDGLSLHLNNDYWKGNIKKKNGIPPGSSSNKEVIKVYKPLYHEMNDVRYKLRFIYDNVKEDDAEDLLFKVGFFTDITLSNNQFNDKTKYIGIFHDDRIHKNGNSQVIEDHKKHYKKDKSNIRKGENGFVTLEKAKTDEEYYNDKIVSIEEMIGVKEDMNIEDDNTQIELLNLKVDSNTSPAYNYAKFHIHSPLLYHLHREYKRCIESLSNSIWIRNNEPYDPYHLDPLRVAILGKNQYDQDVIFAIFPLYDFTNPTMTIASYSFDLLWINDVIRNKNEPKEALPSFYNKYYDLLKTLFNNQKQRKPTDEYNSIILSQKYQESHGIYDDMIENTLFNTKNVSNGFYIGKMKKGMTIHNVKGLKLVVFYTLTNEPTTRDNNFTYGSTIQITPNRTLYIPFIIKDKTSVNIGQSIKKNSSFTIQFIITNRKDDRYFKYGMIDRFSEKIYHTREDISFIELIYDKSRDELVYKKENNLLQIYTTDKKFELKGLYTIQFIKLDK